MTISNSFYLTLIHYWYICNRSIFEVVYSLNLMWVKVGESVEKGGKSPLKVILVSKMVVEESSATLVLL